ncbi:MAG TPA: c-type cytochrome [Alphaproteobacteria bacterium]|jgi:cytochrome c|nr:c-type cytochrome [Alphaproteobacteria bacterium]
MKEMTVTKILGAILFAALVVMAIKVVTNHLYGTEGEEPATEQAAPAEQAAAPAQPAEKPAEMKKEEAPAAAPAKEAAPAAPAATETAAAGGGNADAGAQVFKNHLCFACHSFEAGKNGAGPSLHGVFGGKAGEAPGFSFSDDLKNSGLVWNEENLDKWVQGPQKVVAGAKMMLAKPVTDAGDRANLIAYIKREASK